MANCKEMQELDLHGGFWWQEELRGVFCGGPPEAAPVYNGGTASGSRLDPLLAKVKSVSVRGAASAMTHMRRELICAINCVW